MNTSVLRLIVLSAIVLLSWTVQDDNYSYAQQLCDPPTRIGGILIVRPPDDGNGGTPSINSAACGDGEAVYGGHSEGNYGFLGNGDYGVFGSSSTGHAGFFEGDVKVTGKLTIEGAIKSNGVIMLPRYALAPITCDSTNAGAMYFDTNVAMSGAQGACICMFSPVDDDWIWSPTWQASSPRCD